MTEDHGTQTASVTRAMAVVMAPQMILASGMHGISALGPAITAGAGLPPEAIGLIGGLVGAGSVWFFAASGAVLGPLGPARALTATSALSSLALLTILAGDPAALFLAAPLISAAVLLAMGWPWRRKPAARCHC